MKETEVLARLTHVNGWGACVYNMSYMSQNFRLFQVSNLSVLNFRSFLLMQPESIIGRLLSTPAVATLCQTVKGKGEELGNGTGVAGKGTQPGFVSGGGHGTFSALCFITISIPYSHTEKKFTPSPPCTPLRHVQNSPLFSVPTS